MGRLRNISASFKTAAFPTAATSSTPSNHDGATRQTSNKDAPTIVRETSSNSIPAVPESSSIIRPNTMIYTPPTIGAVVDEIEELRPVFNYLSSHSNKLYQEGYFLKLDDLDTNGRPNPQRVWTECFAQLVGTILSFWDAEALDAAGQDGEVAPSFINLADASIKMIETLPTRNQSVQPLQNVLSVSTAGKNRYLLHFNSLHSLTQWTAGIRLAMFENASLQELYTGSLIAGKGRHLNSINQIMTKNKYRIEDWARVRFGAGTPWRRCWCVIEPPDEKEWQKSQKKLGKKSAYEKTHYPKGNIKFYDTKKIKKALPIATITDAYSAYAIYPQSKPLINESTLVKLEGKITIHSQPESKTEGFVFVMPEVHPAVSGFEMMLRWLLPVYDTFSLYGRPNRLVPDTLDTRSLMFAMPKERRYGYLDIIDISALIHTDDSDKWTEREWRKRMKEAVARRMAMQIQGRASNIEGIRNPGNARAGLQFSDSTSSLSNAHRRNESSDAVFETPKKTFTAPAHLAGNHHSRSASESIQLSASRKVRDPHTREFAPARLSEEYSPAQSQQYLPPQISQSRQPLRPRINDAGYMDSANSSDSETQGHINADEVEQDMIQHKPVQPVMAPPDFNHQPNEQPRKRPSDRPDLRREKSRMSDATLSQMNPRALEEIRQESIAREQNMQGGGTPSNTAAMHAWRQNGDQSQSRGVNETPADEEETMANSQRPELVTNPSSTSIQSFIRRKPVADSTVQPTDMLRPPIPRQFSETSNYSTQNQDRDSSPDGASRKLHERPVDNTKTRGGTRKVIGDAPTQELPVIESLQIDFGRTQRLTPESSEPSHSRPITATGLRSPFEALGLPETSNGRKSPSDPYDAGLTGRKSPLNPSPTTPPAQTPEKRSPNDRSSYSRPQSQVWYPGNQGTLAAEPSGMSAQEFVQQRFATASKSRNYVANRTTSAGRVEQIKSDSSPQSPPSPQSKSPRKLQKRATESRNSSGNSIDYTAHLSAREQEHVAKMTGGPLLNMSNAQSRIPDPKVGLIGAISAREQERRNIKEGLQGHMVQAAIDQQVREARAKQMQATHQRTQSQYVMQQQYQGMGQNPYQNPNLYPTQSEYGPQQLTQSVQQPYWNQIQSQYPSQQAQPWRPQRPEPPQQSQSMYTVQQSQGPAPSQMQPRTPQGASGTVRPEMRVMQGAPYRQSQPSTHARSQSAFTQYSGFYAPQR